MTSTPVTQNPSTASRSLEATAVAQLADRVTGAVLAPGADGYDDAHRIFMQVLNRTPAVVVRATDANDVATAIGFAREHDLEIAVRSGGHSGAGHSTVDGGLVIDLRVLDNVQIDTRDRTAWVGAGATAAAVTAATGEHGLVIGFGDTGSVGVGGITLAGGQGFLSRKYGLTIDNLLAVEVVTADGRIVVADSEHEPDLFWALRGGGGNFGVATRFKYQLHELPEVVGGMLMLPATAETVTAFVRLSLAAPEELTTIANVMVAPPMPMIPEALHGKLVLMGLLTYAGPSAEGEAAVAPFRAIATPFADLVRPMPYSGMFGPEQEGNPGFAFSRNGFASDFDEGDARTILDTLGEHGSRPGVAMAAVQLRTIGGAVSQVPADATAYAHRDWPLMVNVAAMVTGHEYVDRQAGWVEALVASLSAGTPGAYAGFVNDEGPDRIYDVYPSETYDRLAEVKRAWDPQNVFHRNHTVAPAA